MSKMGQELERRLDENKYELYKSLKTFVEMYVRMVNSGDCGFWNPEDDDEVLIARRVLAKIEGQQSMVSNIKEG